MVVEIESSVFQDEEWWGDCRVERSRRRGRLFLLAGRRVLFSAGLLWSRMISYALLRLRTYLGWWYFSCFPFLSFVCPISGVAVDNLFPSNADATKKKRLGRENRIGALESRRLYPLSFFLLPILAGCWMLLVAVLPRQPDFNPPPSLLQARHEQTNRHTSTPFLQPRQGLCERKMVILVFSLENKYRGRITLK